MPTVMLTSKLAPVEDALQRLRVRAAPGAIIPDDRFEVPDPDVLAVLEGLTAVVRDLSGHRWTVI